jgi:hypothetical protein
MLRSLWMGMAVGREVAAKPGMQDIEQALNQ